MSCFQNLEKKINQELKFNILKCILNCLSDCPTKLRHWFVLQLIDSLTWFIVSNRSFVRSLIDGFSCSNNIERAIRFHKHKVLRTV